MTDFKRLIELLCASGVEFVVIGGVAAGIHGSSYATFDLDICYARNRPNLERLEKVLFSIQTTLRNVPPGLPFKADAETMRHGMNFTFDTSLGKFDLLGEVSGVGMYEQAIAGADYVELFGYRCAIFSLPQLISSKRAAGRPKDLAVVVELEALYEQQQALEEVSRKNTNAATQESKS